ncbi:tuberin isoform X1 [Drosophila sulfurigaster albostrigata]|uniref:tuberin isoform X1 n=1 Tax=Drosophila sulfurigaster albostrigata TaxID=89887 RepID=UPI002D21B765|nr:tuberin isoform X1 [Drosophila sulfurigaster albostrigata]
MMSSKDKSKFKMFLKTTKPAGAAGERTLRPEFEIELRPEQPIAQRCKMLKELGDQHLHNINLDEVSKRDSERGTIKCKQNILQTSITKLWHLTNDLIVPNKPAETRQIALSFYKRLIHTQYKSLTLMREKFFLVIQNHEAREDLRHLLKLLITLTENGKDITNFEEKIGKFMLHWMPDVKEAHQLSPYLDMLINLIKFNAAHLDKDILVGIVENACKLSYTEPDDDIGLQCLTILELVIGYTIFPSETLHQCIVTLCWTVNHVRYCHASYKIMKNLLGTQLGFDSMKLMCCILNDRSQYSDGQLLRGAVFHLNINIFGSNMIFQVSPMNYATNVLKGFLNALESRQVIVTYEVILSVRMVITKHKLSEIIWDLICDIMSAIVDNIEYYERSGVNNDSLAHLQKNFHENIDCIEKLLQDDRAPILGNVDRIYDLIERVAERRSEASVLGLIEYRTRRVTATRPEWLQTLTQFVRRYYRMSNVNVRIKTIESLVQIMNQNRSGYEEEILDRVVVTQLAQIHQEPSAQVRMAVARALCNFAVHCDTKRCMELLDILETLINRPFEHMRQVASEGLASELGNSVIVKSETEIGDIVAAVSGLIEVFVVKLHRLPAAHAIKIFNILMDHLELHYDRPKVFEQASIVRLKIFNWMLKARANSSYHIGYPDGNSDVVKFSHYLGIDSALPPQTQTTTISIRRACKLIVRCLEQDTDYQVFQLVIKELPKVLQNKALIQGNDIEELAKTLFKINSSSTNKFKRPTDEFDALVLQAIASLVIYYECMQSTHHNKIIAALKSRILTGTYSASVCINTLTILMLEMPDALMRTLPDVLLQMSRMSDTNTVAIPVLEFLSLLIHLSNHLFSNFTPKQNMYVFALSLTYTKPHRYDHYTVSLAHHVIAGWFLKCKLEQRRNFVGYIKSSMQSNAQMLYNDIVNINSLNVNEDSSNRKRSTSLTERGSRNSAATRNDSEMRPLMNNSLRTFHAELAETCFDFLERHTFSPCPALPKRLPAIDYLLKDGVSQTWLVGHNLITITTSGCPSGPTRNGLCERCTQLGKAPSISLNSKNLNDGAGEPTLSPEQERRYTKLSLQHSSGNESAGSTEQTSSSSASNSGAHPHRQISNSSTASLDTYSRRGSNPEASNLVEGSHTGSNTSLLGNSMSLSTASMGPGGGSIQGSFVQQPVCVRSCTGWAEIYIRRPTGNISWITRIQNPITSDCFGQDLPFNSMVSMFLPTSHGGVFGPDNLMQPQQEQLLQQQQQQEQQQLQLQKEQQELLQKEQQHQQAAARQEPAEELDQITPTASEMRKRMMAKARALQRQEEIHHSVSIASNSGVGGTAAIDIPMARMAGKRGKDAALSGSVSDGEADDDVLAFGDAQSRARNPVRRVNSSPEMSSSWRQAILAAKPAPLSSMGGVLEPEMVLHEQEPQLPATGAKKKNVQYSTKDMRVSCEAIPEEIAGSTPPQAQGLQPAAAAGAGAGTLPPKQHSADDVSSQVAQVQTSASASSLKLGKPPLSPGQVATPAAAAPAAVSAAKQTLAPVAAKLTSYVNASLGLAKSNSSGGNNDGDYNNGGGDMMRGRSKTISVVREVNNGKARPPAPAVSSFRSFGATKPPISAKLCMNPSFVFLQLYSTGQLEVTETPLKVGPEQSSALSLLDLVPPFETHKIGVLYVGPNQCNNEVEILRNSHGSTRYVDFLRSIGTLVSLKDAEANNLFIGLDKSGADGKFAYIWKDDILQVTFHVATLMPTNLQDDPNCNEKKKHIGNDFVKIIYNESGEEYNLTTISGHFNYACVIVEPLELNSNRVYVKARSEISKFVCHPEPRIVSDRSAPLLARQMALHANLASLVYQSVQKKNPYASNWLERLRKLKRLRSQLIEQQVKQQQSKQQQSGNTTSGGGIASSSEIDDQRADFTKFT